MMAMTKAKIAVAVVLLLLILAINLNAVSLLDTLSKSFTRTSGIQCSGVGNNDAFGWIALSFIALLVSLAIASLAWIIKGMFMSQKFDEFMKGMLWNIIETAGLLSILSLAFLGLQDFGIKNIDKARAYTELTRSTLTLDFSVLVVANYVMGMLMNVNPQFPIRIVEQFVTFGFQVAPMFKPFMDMLGLMLQLVTAALALWSGESYLLCFIKDNMLVLLMPAGFFLRAYGINGGGNALIGMGLALYFVFPYMVVMTGEVITEHITNKVTHYKNDADNAMTTCAKQPICCLAPGTMIPGPNDDWVPNGVNWRTDSSNRVKVATLIQGGLYTGSWEAAKNNNNYCVFNTITGSAWNATVDKINDILGIDLNSILMLGGGAISFAIMKYLNMKLMLLLIVPLVSFMLTAIVDIVYFVFIASIVVPIFIVFITLTIAKEITGVLGTQIELSALEKLL